MKNSKTCMQFCAIDSWQRLFRCSHRKKKLSVKLAKNGPENIWSVKVGVHLGDHHFLGLPKQKFILPCESITLSHASNPESLLNKFLYVRNKELKMFEVREPWSSWWYSRSKGSGFTSQRWILDRHFFTLYYWTNLQSLLEKNELNGKRGRGWPIKHVLWNVLPFWEFAVSAKSL